MLLGFTGNMVSILINIKQVMVYDNVKKINKLNNSPTKG
ncbi:hypothetical protein BAME_36490 [Bacillus sp. M 2-6]|nr:hypothetical protein BAME_36490 [Bacillus sp. M 2-6]PYH25837.1 hypothetical protein US8_03641 [Bacillus altitudinis]